MNIGNITKLIDAKGNLIRKALGSDALRIEMKEDRVAFPWFTEADADSAKACTDFIAALCRMSKEVKRVAATEKEVEMRIRGNKVRVYSGSSYTLRFTANISGFSGGYAGYRFDNCTVCELMRLGDACTYEPYEQFDVIISLDFTTRI